MWTLIQKTGDGKTIGQTTFPSRAAAAKAVRLFNKCKIIRDQLNSTYTVTVSGK